MTGAQRIVHAVRSPKRGSTALVAYLTAGWPQREGFGAVLDRVADVADIVEIGVPFSDPMADGVTLQRTSREAIAGGVTVRWIADVLAKRGRHATPTLLMSYCNPLLQFGWAGLADACGEGVDGWIVPDLPIDEAADCDAVATARGLGRVYLVAPNTPDARVRRLAAASTGFLYAVTVTGITGAALGEGVGAYLERVRGLSGAPLCAGFGVRTHADFARLGADADGVIVGTALVEAIGRGEDPAAFLTSLRGA